MLRGLGISLMDFLHLAQLYISLIIISELSEQLALSMLHLITFALLMAGLKAILKGGKSSLASTICLSKDYFIHGNDFKNRLYIKNNVL